MTNLSNQRDDTCPRCGRGFHCGVADAAPCPCATLHLGTALLADLRQRYQGCLCLACLSELSAPVPPAASPPAPEGGSNALS